MGEHLAHGVHLPRAAMERVAHGGALESSQSADGPWDRLPPEVCIG
jgi:hypothetical protein